MTPFESIAADEFRNGVKVDDFKDELMLSFVTPYKNYMTCYKVILSCVIRNIDVFYIFIIRGVFLAFFSHIIGGLKYFFSLFIQQIMETKYTLILMKCLFNFYITTHL